MAVKHHVLAILAEATAANTLDTTVREIMDTVQAYVKLFADMSGAVQAPVTPAIATPAKLEVPFRQPATPAPAPAPTQPRISAVNAPVQAGEFYDSGMHTWRHKGCSGVIAAGKQCRCGAPAPAYKPGQAPAPLPRPVAPAAPARKIPAVATATAADMSKRAPEERGGRMYYPCAVTTCKNWTIIGSGAMCREHRS